VLGPLSCQDLVLPLVWVGVALSSGPYQVGVLIGALLVGVVKADVVIAGVPWPASWLYRRGDAE
jgi:hypothetical protein